MTFESLIPLAGQVGSVLNRFTMIRQLAIAKEPLQRLFLVECECNIALLACLRLDDESAGQSGAAYWMIASSLETGVLEAILGSGDEESKVFTSLKTIPLLSHDAGEQADKDIGEGGKDEVVSEKLRRLYVNVYSVRASAKVHLEIVKPKDSGMRDMRFRTRLKNLRKVYLEVSNSLKKALGSDAA